MTIHIPHNNSWAWSIRLFTTVIYATMRSVSHYQSVYSSGLIFASKAGAEQYTSSISTFSKMTLSIKGIIVTLIIDDTQHKYRMLLCPVLLCWVLHFLHSYAEHHCALSRYAENDTQHNGLNCAVEPTQVEVPKWSLPEWSLPKWSLNKWSQPMRNLNK